MVFVLFFILSLLLFIDGKEIDEDGACGVYWESLGVSTSSLTTILESFDGFVGNGRICGVLGPSGSGKSTFLSAVASSSHKQLQVNGSVWVRDQNGKDSVLSLQNGQVAFLAQHDSFFQMLTVRETLEIAAYLQFPNMPKLKRDQLIGRNLDALGLSHVAHRVVGDASEGGPRLSGGERRRLSVGLELLSAPQLFLADESTTGLDSSQAVKIVRLISDLSKEREIPAILTMHQPRAKIWKMLDDIILLAPGGRVCYVGPREEAISYFWDLGYECPPETNPAEFLIDLVSVDTEDSAEASKDEERINGLFHAFRRKSLPKKGKTQMSSSLKSMTPQDNRLRGIPLRRLLALLRRSWRQNIRNNRYTIARVIASLGSSLLFSQIFKSCRKGAPVAKSIADRTALLSFGAINLGMMALMKTVYLFSKERGVVDREQKRQQYSSLEYILSKSIAEIPLDAFFAGLFTTGLKITTGLRISWSKITSIFALMTASGASLGFAIGGLRKDGETAMTTALPVMVLFIAVAVINPSGVDKTSPPPLVVKLLKLMSPIKWAIEALVVEEFRGMDLREGGPNMPWQRIKDLPKMGAFVMVENGDQVLDSLGLEDATYNTIMNRMALLSTANLAVSWFGLEWHRRTSKPKKNRKVSQKKHENDVDAPK
mmetsp:Transcript_12465/g.19210  ORF Transcript_12465/g.19210 Transcript_12465/m.19210 type:complete len:656 (-) Transcript_12465:48-2015(-)